MVDLPEDLARQKEVFNYRIEINPNNVPRFLEEER